MNLTFLVRVFHLSLSFCFVDMLKFFLLQRTCGTENTKQQLYDSYESIISVTDGGHFGNGSHSHQKVCGSLLSDVAMVNQSRVPLLLPLYIEVLHSHKTRGVNANASTIKLISFSCPGAEFFFPSEGSWTTHLKCSFYPYYVVMCLSFALFKLAGSIKQYSVNNRHTLRKTGLPRRLLTNFYQCSIESTLSYGLTVRFSTCNGSPRWHKRSSEPRFHLWNRPTLPNWETAEKIRSDCTHHGQGLFDTLPCDRSLPQGRAQTERLKNSFFLNAVRALL